MANAIPTPASLRSNVPSDRVLHAINPFVAGILRSPFHRLLSRQLMLLTYTGRKTGKRYTIPVGYARDGQALLVFSSHPWWRNLGDGTPVEVLLQGRRFAGTAVPLKDPAVVMAAVEQTITSYGRKGASWRIGIALDATTSPSRAEIAQVMADRAVIRVTMRAPTSAT